MHSPIRAWLNVSSPERVALRGLQGRSLSYSELAQALERNGAALRELGAGWGHAVLALLPSGFECMVAGLSAMATGAYLPLNPELRADELQRVVTVVRPRLALVQAEPPPHLLTVLAHLEIPVVRVMAARGGVLELRAESAWAAPPPISLDPNVMLVLSTSGTSGEPKLVPLSCANLRAAASQVARSLELGPSDVGLNVMPMFHVGGLVDQGLAVVASGGQVVCTSGFDAAQMPEWLNSQQPTWLQLVPTMLAELLRQDDLSLPSSLRLIRSVSSPLSPELRARAESAFAGELVEMYGMSEAGGVVFSPPLGQRRHGSVGVPWGVDVRIVAEDGSALPSNREGEVWVRGESVMAGYLGQDEGGVRDGWFATGDLGVLDHEGWLTLRGRLKEQINRGGEKISPLEVEATLRRHPHVLDVAAFGVAHPTLGEEVAVAVVAVAGATPDEAALRSFAREYLSPHKVPRRVVLVHALPKGPTGKVSRRDLTRTHSAQQIDEGPGSLSPLQQRVAELWSLVLGVPVTERSDNFFLLGGDSLQAARFTQEIERRWHATVHVGALYDAPTLGELCDALEADYPALTWAARGTEQPSADTQRGARVELVL